MLSLTYPEQPLSTIDRVPKQQWKSWHRTRSRKPYILSYTCNLSRKRVDDFARI